MEYLESIESEKSFVIHFSGPSIDSEGMPVDELLVSLDGWRSFIELAFTLHIRGTLTAQPLEPEQRVRLHVKRLGPGGSIVAVLLAVGGIAAATVIQEETKRGWNRLRPKAWRLATRLYRTLLSEKREQRSLHDTAAAIEQVAREEGLAVDDNSDPVAVTADLDQAVSRATSPLDGTASEISIDAPGTDDALDVRRQDRVALVAPFPPEPPVVDTDAAFQAMVEFVKVDRKNGSGLIKFAHPQGDDQKGIRQCRITDKRGLSTSRDPYTGSLHCTKPVKLWVRKAITNVDTGRFRWEVSQNPPSTAGAGLFDAASSPSDALAGGGAVT